MSEVWFRLLGDVEAEVAGRRLDIGHARQRCVLAALLVDANRVVPVDQLIDRVWPGRLPQRARNTMSGYLSRLRTVLCAETEVRIVRRHEGYLIAVNPASVDLHRFRQLVTQARRSDDVDRAESVFDEALALWRGEPFAGLDTLWLNGLRDGLVAERLAAQLDRNDLALMRGRHAEVLGRISALSRAYPLDERLAGQLMLALYRNGRQADALRCHERLRHRLAEELGADPGPDVQRLYQQILSSDLTLAVPLDRGEAGSPVPRQLPPGPRTFAGRVRELTDLDTVLAAPDGAAPTVAISVVSGTAGVGKTALAVHWAHRVSQRFPDGQLYQNLRGFGPGEEAVTPAAAIRGFLDALGVAPHRIPQDLDAQAALYRSVLADKRVLVVLDNARDAEQIRPLLPGSASSRTIVTSRNHLTSLVAIDGAVPVGLDVLGDDEARDLLGQRLGADRLAAEPWAAEEIIAACARLPLALTIAAARAAGRPGRPLASVSADLREAQSRLDVLVAGDPASEVRTVMSWSYMALTPPAARLFRLLGLHPGPDVNAAAAASIAGHSPARVRTLLAELENAGMLSERVPGRYGCHDLLRAYAADLMQGYDRAPERLTALTRMLDHYTHTAYSAARLVNPQRDHPTLGLVAAEVTPEPLGTHQEAVTWLAAECSVLLAMVGLPDEAGFRTHAMTLAWALDTYLDRAGRWHDLVAVWRSALSAAAKLDDESAQGLAHRAIACAHTRLGRYADAHVHYGLAFERCRRTGDLIGEAHTHHALTYLLRHQGRNDQALDHAGQALNRYRAASHWQGQARALNAVGSCRARLGEHHQALADCERALAMHQELGDEYGAAKTWESLGYTRARLGDHGQAVDCYHRAHALLRRLGDRYEEAGSLISLGDAYRDAGSPDAGRTAWQEALAILVELDHPDADAVRETLHTADATC